MKKIILLLTTILFFTPSFTQMDCENFKTFTASYVFTKTVAAGGDFFTETGFTAQMGAAFTYPRKYTIKTPNYEMDSLSNSFDLFAAVGWRLWRIDYVVSLFAYGGYTMGDQYKAQPFTSLKILFPSNNKAFSFEPVYIFGRGMTGKLSIHVKI
jgi:hypothetical protein